MISHNFHFQYISFTDHHHNEKDMLFTSLSVLKILSTVRYTLVEATSLCHGMVVSYTQGYH